MILSTVVVSAEADEQEISPDGQDEWSTVYVISDKNVIGVNGSFITFTTGDNEEYKISYGEKVEFSSGGYTIIGGGTGIVMEYFTFTGENGGMMVGPIEVVTEAPKSNMVTVNCSSVIAPALSATLVTATLISAWFLKKKRDDQ